MLSAVTEVSKDKLTCLKRNWTSHNAMTINLLDFVSLACTGNFTFCPATLAYQSRNSHFILALLPPRCLDALFLLGFED